MNSFKTLLSLTGENVLCISVPEIANCALCLLKKNNFKIKIKIKLLFVDPHYSYMQNYEWDLDGEK